MLKPIPRYMLAAAFVGATLVSATVQARGGHGGGHGGGHHGGEHHGGAHKGGEHKEREHNGGEHRKAEHHRNEHHHADEHHADHHAEHRDNHRGWHHDAQGWVNGRHGVDRPFTNDWYAHHAGAWRYNYLAGGLWGWAGIDTVNSWLGWTTYDINNTAAPEANQASVPTIGQSPILAANYDEAATPNGENKPAGDWLPLGVFALEPPTVGGEQLVQFALRRDGTIEGVAYSKATDESSNLVGEVDRETNKAYWKLDANQKVSFAAPLKTLTSGEGPVEVTLADGEKETWTSARLKQPTK